MKKSSKTPSFQTSTSPSSSSTSSTDGSLSSRKSSLSTSNYQDGATALSPSGGGMGFGVGEIWGAAKNVWSQIKSANEAGACYAPPDGDNTPPSHDSTASESSAPTAATVGSMPEDPATGWGAVIGDVHGVSVRRNLVSDLAALKNNVPGISTGKSGYLTVLRTTYGYSYQCVELVNRYFSQALGHTNMIRTGHAKDYLGSGDRGLETHKRGGSARPHPGDLMVDLDGGGGFGHVGIVKTASDTEMTVAQQNTANPMKTTSLSQSNGGWSYGEWDGFRRKPGAAPNTTRSGGQSPIEKLAGILGLETVVSAIQSTSQTMAESLSHGDKGPRVEALQRALVKAKFMAEKDRLTGPGIFGPKTKAAVIAFQSASGLDATGIADAKTLLALAVYRTPEQRADDDVKRDAQASQNRHDAVKNLGSVSSFGEDLYGKVGGVVDAIVPSAGDESSLRLAFNIPIATSGMGSAKLGMNLEGEAERDHDKGVRLKVKVGGVVTGEVDLAIVEAFAQFELFGWLESYGDSGYETMKLVSFALEQRTRELSDFAADFIWGEDFAGATRKSMDDDDYVVTGVGMSGGAGFDSKNVKNSTGFLDVDAAMGTRLTKNGIETESRKSAEVAFSAGRWSGAVRYEKTTVGGKSHYEVDISPTREVDITEFASEMSDPSRVKETLRNWMFEVVGTVHAVLTGKSGLLAGDDAQKAGAIFDTVRSLDPSQDMLVDQAVLKMASLVKSLNAVKMGQMLNINVNWTQRKSGWDGSLSIDLNQVRSIQVGDNQASTFYAKVEDISNLLHAGPISLTR